MKSIKRLFRPLVLCDGVRRLFALNRAALLSVALTLPSFACAQEAHYFSLPREGTASVFVDAATNRATIVDGGRKDSLAAPLLDGKDVITALRDRRINELVIVCSHPHDDHQGGLMTLIAKNGVPNKRLLEFGKVTFVDSGYGDSDSLFEYYRSSFGPDYAPDRVSRQSAKNRDVLGLILPGSDGTNLRNFAYDPGDSPHPHGSSVITMSEITKGDAKQRIVDFDDANDDVVGKWVEWAREKPSDRRPDIMVLPHHGTDTSDVGLLMSDSIRPKDVIITANPQNRFGHPGTETLTKLSAAIGLERVHVTGATGTVSVLPSGISDGLTDKARKAALLDAVIEPRLRDAELKMAVLQERAAEFASSPKLKKRHDALVQEVADILALRADCLDQPKGKAILSVSPLPKIEPVLGGDLPGADAFKELLSDVPSAGGGGASVPRAKSRELRFKASVRGRPIFGGVVLGNKATVLGGKLKSATVGQDEDGLFVAITVADGDKAGKTGKYRDFTPGELWSAFQLVGPSQEFRTKYGANAGECNLVGMVANKGSYWDFAIHPAISGSLLARDGMRLDMFITASSPSELTPVEGKWTTYQWYDAEAEVSVTDGDVDVRSSGNPDIGCVMRLRLWGMPDWAQSKDAFMKELWRRYAARFGALGDKPTDLELASFYADQKRKMRDEVLNGHPVEFDTIPIIKRSFGEFDALRRIDRFARLVALINAIADAENVPFPALPDSVRQSRMGVQAFYYMNLVLPPQQP